ncbi:hypothetical protein CCACVL1_18095 [Corchorus capsularis]|uniref:Uncharacterized protein n=1 Tax=Corchorus capsularis TaxID=210143 RepID=A0A1R3HMT8_COCAP|nr:hypothetical protein CCACVL1_18095 [Corchorus capsularis]
MSNNTITRTSERSIGSNLKNPIRRRLPTPALCCLVMDGTCKDTIWLTNFLATATVPSGKELT